MAPALAGDDFFDIAHMRAVLLCQRLIAQGARYEAAQVFALPGRTANADHVDFKQFCLRQVLASWGKLYAAQSVFLAIHDCLVGL